MNTELHEFVRQETVRNFGEPSHSMRFQGPEEPNPFSPFPPFLDIYVWKPDTDSDLTTCGTNGISQRPLTGHEFRGEVHFAIQGKISAELEKQLGEFLANLALFPFSNKTSFDWWSSFGLSGVIPGFKTCNAIVLHPPFHEQGWAQMHWDEFDIKILNAVPITSEEHTIITSKSIPALQDFWGDKQINLFKQR